MNIQDILKTITHNGHCLNRYIKYINYCKTNIKKDEYLEAHHICPKNLFPKYKSLKSNKWNKVNLTYREHVIAHVMLWKAYGGSQVYGLNALLNQFKSKTKKVPTSLEMRYSKNIRKETSLRMSNRVVSDKTKEKMSEYSKGKTVYKDSSGNTYRLDTNDPLIKDLNLVGITKGIKMSDSNKEILSKNNTGKTVYKDSSGKKYFLMIDDPKIKDLGLVGVSKGIPMTEEAKRKSSEVQSGFSNYKDLNGKLYRLQSGDTKIKELNLFGNRSWKRLGL